MKPYDRISLKAVYSTIIILLTLCLVVFLSGRILGGLFNWIIGISIDIDFNYFGYAFCNPTLWFLGLDEIMWESPQPESPSFAEIGLLLLCIISFIAHAFAIILSFCKLGDTWDSIHKKK